MTNNADPEANWSGFTLFAKTGHVMFSKRRVNDTSTIVGHFVSSPTEMEKRYRRTGRWEKREKAEDERKKQMTVQKQITNISLPKPAASTTTLPLTPKY